MFLRRFIFSLMMVAGLSFSAWSDKAFAPDSLAMKDILADAPLPEVSEYVVHDGDTIKSIAKKYQTTIELIKIRNHLKDDFLHNNQKLQVWKVPFTISINKKKKYFSS